MIPLKIDSPVRAKNITLTLDYLLKNYDCPIIITEADEFQKAKVHLPNDKRITYRFHELKYDEPFHRTRYLNEMTCLSKTECVANWDADVMLDKETLVEAVRLLMMNNFDVVYPYDAEGLHVVDVTIPRGLPAWLYVKNGWTESPSNFLKGGVWTTESYDPFLVLQEDKNKKIPALLRKMFAIAGHCQIIKKESYLKGFLENENFISWGPEDLERLSRFKKLGLSVTHMKNCRVYHLNHPKSKDSGLKCPTYTSNKLLWERLKKMNKDELIEYYEGQSYLKKYANEASGGD